jgi:zinc D-Ala-D-Ala dipeptidase
MRIFQEAGPMAKTILRGVGFLCTLLLATLLGPAKLGHANGQVSLRLSEKPLNAPEEWNRLVGIYGTGTEAWVLLERDQKLFRHIDTPHDSVVVPDSPVTILGEHTLKIESDTDKNTGPVTYESGETGVMKLIVNGAVLLRADAGTNPTNFFHVTLKRPLDEIRVEAMKAKPPREAGPFRKPDLVELVKLNSGVHLDIRYAQADNFLSAPVYTQARAYLQRPAAEALLRALRELRPLGYGLLIHDAYRPWYVTKIFWDATPAKDRIFVADPQKGSKHNRGCAVDLTLYDLATGKAIEMPGLYDEMSPRSFPQFPGGTSLQRWHRDLLRQVMEKEGFTVDEHEWWHFDYKDWKHYPILNMSFEDLGKAQLKASEIQ